MGSLQEPPRSLSEKSAGYVANLNLGALTQGERSELIAERDLLRRFRDGTLTAEEQAELRIRRQRGREVERLIERNRES